MTKKKKDQNKEQEKRDDSMPIEEPSSSNVSQYLKYLRQKKGVSIKEAANYLKINAEYLKAFEEDNLDSLPNDMYIKIFLRSYADYLDGDGKAVLAGFNQMLDEKKGVKSNHTEEKRFNEEISMPFQMKEWWEKRPRRSMRSWIIAGIVLIVFVGTFYLKSGKNKLSNDISFQEESIFPSEEREEKTEAEGEEIPEMSKEERLPVAAGVSKKKAVLSALALDDVNLEMTIDRKITIKEILKKGETRIWMANKGFVINTDNIGALDFTFNNERFGVLGELGESMENIRFPREEE